MALPAKAAWQVLKPYLDMMGARAKHDISTSLQEGLAQLAQAAVWLPPPIWPPMNHHHQQVGA